jgi:ubiquinone/menaquinone biosynthesis C-methylase UbiE
VIALDLGCGDAKTAGCIGYDARPLPGVDVVGDARVLPFLDNSIDFIFCHHVLEHFTKQDAKGLLREVYRVLSPDGTLHLACPDMVAMAKTYLYYVQQGNWTELEKLTANYYGGGTYELNRHFWGYSLQPLREILCQAGFLQVQEIKRRDIHEVYVEAIK